MTRNRRWYVQLVLGFVAMLTSMGLVDRYITPAVAATPQQVDLTQADSASTPIDDMRVVALKANSDARKPVSPNPPQVPGMRGRKQPKFWVGIRCHAPVPAALRSHVKIPEGQGLLVIDVVDKGPGKKAGIQKDDILINIGNAPLQSVVDLIRAVENAKGKPVDVGLLRNGKSVMLTIQPEKRPKEMKRPAIPSFPNSPDMENIRRMFEQAQPGQGNKPGMRLQFFHPGTVLPRDGSIHPGLPNNLSISINRTGKNPAKILVKQYDAKTKKERIWKLTEKDLSPLPNHIRPHVERMLNGVVAGSMPQFDFMPLLGPSRLPDPLKHSNDRFPSPPNSVRDNSQLRKDLEQMQEQMNKMNRMMEQVQQRIRSPQMPPIQAPTP